MIDADEEARLRGAVKVLVARVTELVLERGDVPTAVRALDAEVGNFERVVAECEQTKASSLQSLVDETESTTAHADGPQRSSAST